jgi:hypothetical protein
MAGGKGVKRPIIKAFVGKGALRVVFQQFSVSFAEASTGRKDDPVQEVIDDINVF